jgi:hypothetical protein
MCCHTGYGRIDFLMPHEGGYYLPAENSNLEPKRPDNENWLSVERLKELDEAAPESGDIALSGNVVDTEKHARVAGKLF